MKEAIYVVVILLQVFIIVYFMRRNRQRVGKGPIAGAEHEQGSFEHQRKMALSVTHAQLKLMIPDNITFVYGVVMDWNMGESMVSLAAYITGAANLYLGGGGGVHGAGKNPNVGEAAVKFVAIAADHIERVVPVANTDSALHPGCIRFYLLTNKCIYAGQEQVKYLDDGTSPWLEVFQKGNNVIAEMRS
ncbi:MAG: ribonuclease inhibitor RraB [Flavipsychrobacter sp.]|jgi:hypothetical protein|nr:ribonuclease inhibitor RraB [Flavipsychrobacter sp.]